MRNSAFFTNKIQNFFSYPKAETLGSSANALFRQLADRQLFSSLIIPRAASATRALLRLSPCHRTQTESAEANLCLFPAPLT
jgi:hypothetical protein